jgi:hypothetical protein
MTRHRRTGRRDRTERAKPTSWAPGFNPGRARIARVGQLRGCGGPETTLGSSHPRAWLGQEPSKHAPGGEAQELDNSDGRTRPFPQKTQPGTVRAFSEAWGSYRHQEGGDVSSPHRPPGDSLRPVIPRRVARQQSPPPLHRLGTILGFGKALCQLRAEDPGVMLGHPG